MPPADTGGGRKGGQSPQPHWKFFWRAAGKIGRSKKKWQRSLLHKLNCSGTFRYLSTFTEFDFVQAIVATASKCLYDHEAHLSLSQNSTSGLSLDGLLWTASQPSELLPAPSGTMENGQHVHRVAAAPLRPERAGGRFFGWDGWRKTPDILGVAAAFKRLGVIFILWKSECSLTFLGSLGTQQDRHDCHGVFLTERLLWLGMDLSILRQQAYNDQW